MKCFYYCCFIILINSFFCFGSRDYKADQVLHRTLLGKKVIKWEQPVRHNTLKIIPSGRKNRSISAPDKKQKQVAEQLYLNSKIAGITELYLFPNDYEYSIVYAYLAQKGQVEGKYGNKEIYELYKKEQKSEEREIYEEIKAQKHENQQEAFWTEEVSKKLYKDCKVKTPAWALIRFNKKKFFIAICGEGTDGLSDFISNCSSFFRQLKTVYIGGICGCSNEKFQVGDVLVSNTYYLMGKGVIGDYKDRDEDFRDEENIIQCHGVYFNKKDLETTNFSDTLDFINKIDFPTKGIICHECVNFTSNLFVNQKESRDAICEALNADTVAFNMEDGVLARLCRKKSLKFYAFRVVSDSAGTTPRGKRMPYRDAACEKLGVVFSLLMCFLAKSN